MPTYLRADADQLVIYAIGPGFGESIVVLAPDGDHIVVDTCTHDGTNLTAALLGHLGCKDIDLLVFSHPDTDHIRGSTDVLGRFKPKMIWTYPLAVSLRTHLSQIAQEQPKSMNVQLKDLGKLLLKLEPFREQNMAEDVQSNATFWASSGNGCRVQAIAPLQSDIDTASKQIRQIVQSAHKNPDVADRVVEFLKGRAGIEDHPNLLSIALSVEWKGRKALLGGDVENGTSQFSGWSGIIKRLARHKALGMITGMDVVKVPHHGSNNAFHAAAWGYHGNGMTDSVAMICPFNKSGELPKQLALRGIRKYASRLGMAYQSVEVTKRIRGAGWVRARGGVVVHTDWDLPVVAAVIPSSGPATLHASSASRGWGA